MNSDAIEIRIRSWVSTICPTCDREVPVGTAMVCNGSLYHVACERPTGDENPAPLGADDGTP